MLVKVDMYQHDWTAVLLYLIGYTIVQYIQDSIVIEKNTLGDLVKISIMGSPEVEKCFYNMFAINYLIGFNQTRN